MSQHRDKEMSFIEHLIELKQRFKIVMISLVVTTIFWLAFPADPQGFLSNPTGDYKPFVSNVLEFVTNDMVSGEDAKIILAKPTAGLEIIFIAALFMGIITSFPVIVYEIYAYIDPALYPHERRLLYGFIGAFISLFIIGSLFGFFLAAPIVFKAMILFAKFADLDLFLNAMEFYSLIFTTVLMIGVVFTAPAVFVLLVRLGLLSTSVFTKNRLYIYAGLYIMIAIITPDGWLVGNTVLFLPLVILLESAVYVARRYERKREKESEVSEPQSGSPSVTVLSCKYCGSSMTSDDVFCPSCGRAQQ